LHWLTLLFDILKIGFFFYKDMREFPIRI
jgi:hypothetical protein